MCDVCDVCDACDMCINACTQGDVALSKWGTPRPIVFGWFIGLMVVAMGLLALATPAALYAAVAIGGISYGGK